MKSNLLLDFVATNLYNVATDEFIVFRRMTRKDKLLKRFLRNPQSLKYREIETILLDFGFVKSQVKGSHVKFNNPIFKIILIISIHNNECKKCYKKEVAQTIRWLIGKAY